MRRAILQIGTEKTGTTTLQLFLAANRDVLARRGYCYPRFCGERNHTGLAGYALDPGREDPIREPFGVRSAADVPAMRARMQRAAEAEIDPSATAIFCSEHCHSRLTAPAEVATLRAFLATFFDDVQVCVYLRRQDQVALSLYSTTLKSGGVSPRLLPATDANNPYYNYDRLLALWADAFGAANLHVNIFDRATLAGGSIVTDFLTKWDLGPETDYAPVADHNGSLGPVAQEYLRRVNPHLKSRGGRGVETLRGALASGLERAFTGQGARPAGAKAQRFYALFRASNEAVRARWFPSRATLFDEDFTGYPEVDDDRYPSLDGFAAIAARLHMDAQEEIWRLEAEIALREARLLWTRDQRPAAMAAVRRALNWRPGHAEAHRTLGEYLLRENRLAEAAVSARAAVESRPDNVEYWHFLGMALRKTAAFAEALEAQERALALDPSHFAALRERDQLRARSAEAAPRAARPA